jgi:hypothetical protein
MRELRRLSLQIPVRVKWKLEQSGTRDYLTIIHTIRTHCNKEKDHAAQIARDANVLPAISKGYDESFLPAHERAIQWGRTIEATGWRELERCRRAWPCTSEFRERKLSIWNDGEVWIRRGT